MKPNSTGRRKASSKTERRARKPKSSGRRKASVCGHDPELGCVPKPFMGLIRWTDPQREPDMFHMRVCCTNDGEFAHICMKIPTREIASIELRPARRPMDDHKGNVEDGIRLAGGDTTQ